MKKLQRYARACAVLVLVGVLSLGGSTAIGAAKPAKPSKSQPVAKAETPWMAVIYSVVALAGICVVAFKNPKRTQTD
ncbi:MAG: hypothetical protein HN350_03020 [Phycisphaerales bacterium]|mgnify:CR=1 FL=1|jgi:cytochrome bd-type quinol oxidase subunit 2|nr:hypothetical protein [Phycisphaerales bacterium]